MIFIWNISSLSAQNINDYYIETTIFEEYLDSAEKINIKGADILESTNIHYRYDKVNNLILVFTIIGKGDKITAQLYDYDASRKRQGLSFYKICQGIDFGLFVSSI